MQTIGRAESGSLYAVARNPELEEAHSRYQGYRDAAFDRTWDELHRKVPDGCDLKIMPIDDEALGFWAGISHFRAVHPDGDFPWIEIFQQIRTTPRRFDIAIWDGPILCGLAAGMASRRGENVTLKWIERFDMRSNLPRGFILTTVITAADHYARILGRPLLLMREPNPGMQSRYAGEFGFTLASRRLGALYFQRDVT